MQTKNKIIWTTKSEYVDLETGEALTKKQVEEEYIIVSKQKIKHYEYKYENRTRQTIGIITITNECSRNGKQLRLL